MIKKPKKTSKPYPTFPPLTHDNGSWAKNQGRFHYFGPREHAEDIAIDELVKKFA